MNIVQMGSKHLVFGEDVQTYKDLPAKTYAVRFHPMQGWWLDERPSLATGDEQIYGRHAERVNKIFGSYDLASRNFGVILSGAKGIGKSLLARMIAERGIENQLPVIIVDTAYPGISDFLASVQQRCVIIFDEFEKTFAKLGEDSADPQVEMLSLFDGIDGGKKLFVITCNSPTQLNEYLINRPGRFHYHFEITCPNADDVRAYLHDKLINGFDEEIEKVVKLASMTDITYDCLRAIAFDLSQGYPLEDTLADLNINYERNTLYDIVIKLSNGWQLTAYSIRIDLYGREDKTFRVIHNSNEFYVTIHPQDIVAADGQLMIPGEKCSITTDWDTFSRDAKTEEEAIAMRSEFDKNVKITSLSLVKVYTPAVNKFLTV